MLVYVVDDHEDMRLLMALTLQAEGADVWDGPSTEIPWDQPPDVLVVDLMMPVLDGRQVIARARVEWPESTRIILWTAADDRALEEEPRLPADVTVLRKPTHPDDMIEAVLHG